MLHETAVAWIRYKLARSTPTRPWLETVAEYGSRLKEVVAAINREHNLVGLCGELRQRAEKVRAQQGGRISKQAYEHHKNRDNRL